MVEVYRAADNAEAHLLCGIMQNEGIKARVVGDHLRDVLSHLAIGAVPPRILAPPDGYEAARKIVLAYETRHKAPVDGSAAQWICARCGELNDPTFDVCWQCQSEHGDPAE
ncbi:hypothetical protein CA13_65900 [Planctomycetes bacterium CA13]|uniref:RanBP2-type domain-containing protein n=2 Tax=Novipirellula herctigrandis TaxID=2527986 RepID=A0A5C5ZD70_9BACT|nr:hypothetical protein CA13_65900 [Planctomycetes bacterium CA13]